LDSVQSTKGVVQIVNNGIIYPAASFQKILSDNKVLDLCKNGEIENKSYQKASFRYAYSLQKSVVCKKEKKTSTSENDDMK